jgi:uncharacterized protein (DUF1697 family)
MVLRQPRHRDDGSLACRWVVSQTWVALIRGINVGRAKRISMLDLRSLLESLGYADVRTHGQSGNATFSSGQRSAAAIEDAISARISSDFHMDASVLVRTASEFDAAIDANPFVARGVAPRELHVAFLSAEPAAAKRAGVDRTAFQPDEFAFGNRVIYVRLPNGVMGSTLPDWERALSVRVTQRNWNTSTKLRDLVRQSWWAESFGSFRYCASPP